MPPKKPKNVFFRTFFAQIKAFLMLNNIKMIRKKSEVLFRKQGAKHPLTTQKRRFYLQSETKVPFLMPFPYCIKWHELFLKKCENCKTPAE